MLLAQELAAAGDARNFDLADLRLAGIVAAVPPPFACAGDLLDVAIHPYVVAASSDNRESWLGFPGQLLRGQARSAPV